MLIRPSQTSRGYSLSRIVSLKRPQIPAGSLPLSQACLSHPRRLLRTRPNILPWRRKLLVTHPAAPHRLLATAMDDPLRQDGLSFQSPYPPTTSSPPLYHLRSYDPSKPLLVASNDEAIPQLKARRRGEGLPSGMDEMLCVFDACIQIGSLERASIILERLSDSREVPQADMVSLHNRYLRAKIDMVFHDKPDSKWADSIQRWYEIMIREEGLPYNSETIACMLKVSLLSARNTRLDRLVHRYMDMIPGDNALFEVLSQVEILTEQDIGTITSIYQPASDLIDSLEKEPMDTAPDEQLDIEIPSTKTKATPDVLSVPQKGIGLKMLKGVLSFFDDIDGKDLSKLPLSERREVQARLERDSIDAAIQRWREEHQALTKMGRNTLASNSVLSSHLYDWHCALEKKLRSEFQLFGDQDAEMGNTPENAERALYEPFMRQSTPTRLAAVTILSVLSTAAHQGADKGITVSTVITNLSKAVEDDVRFQARLKQRKIKKSALQGRRIFKPQTTTPATSATPAGDSPNVANPPAYDTESWPILIRTKVGAVLLSFLLDSAKVNVVREHPETRALINQIQPAMSHTNINRKGKKLGVIVLNRWMVDLLKREPNGGHMARHLPMLAEPEPWSEFERGGLLESPTNLVRLKHGEKDQKVYTQVALDRGDMEQVCKGLDVLGKTAWQINRPVFDIMLEAWNSGEKIANLPPLDPDLPLPPEPEASDDPLRRRVWLKAMKAIENKKTGYHSERCFMNLQLEIARAFKDQTFYFPHNMDFRGRAYPIPTYLNHMGADHVRGLLLFAEGKPLGERGLHWLKVHLANVFGFDKASLKEREAFAMNHIAEINETVENPLGGSRWWLEAESPWQCLAACHELKAALDSDNPAEYISHLPVHQDGTCNGLQHYAALGGDSWGAQQVNLEPGDRPADVYSAVANLVKESIAEDLEQDNFLAKAIDGKITRKVVKQTVMTNVYGVTFIGAKAQVLKQIDAAYPNIHNETGVPSSLLASYVATKIFKALSTMFRGAHDIQYWLGECAGRVCRALTPEQLDRMTEAATAAAANPTKAAKAAKTVKAKSVKSFMGSDRTVEAKTDEILGQFKSTIVWTTPLRMPVVQPYRKAGTRIIETCLQDLHLQVPHRSDPVNRRKQLQAFPPNFIHSLDATHMLLSALECHERGLNFAAVHDSFWTHAGDTDVMNRVLRDSFIRIHSEDVVGRLASEFQARYKGSLYLSEVPKDSEAGKKIIAFRKQNPMSLRNEVLRERERVRLLNSTDPEEVKAGQAMETPASLFEEDSTHQISTTEAEMAEVGLGIIPKTMEQHAAESVDDLAKVEEVGSQEAMPEEVEESNEEFEHSKDVSVASKMMKSTQFEMKIGNTMIKKGNNTGGNNSTTRRNVQLWLPLTFPEIPEKGDFDVQRLKDSEYFFS